MSSRPRPALPTVLRLSHQKMLHGGFRLALTSSGHQQKTGRGGQQHLTSGALSSGLQWAGCTLRFSLKSPLPTAALLLLGSTSFSLLCPFSLGPWHFSTSCRTFINKPLLNLPQLILSLLPFLFSVKTFANTLSFTGFLGFCPWEAAWFPKAGTALFPSPCFALAASLLVAPAPSSQA